MPPNHEEIKSRKDSVHSPAEFSLEHLTQTPSPIPSDNFDSTPENLSLTDDFNLLDFNDGSTVVKYERIVIPIEQNLKDLVREITGLTDISEVTKLKLRVISRDVGLQRLSIYTPKLRELILDGSYVSTLRDLGCNLVNLKILRVNRCNLKSLDGMFGLETLEELYAGNNYIEDISSCSSLPLIKLIDVRNNKINDLTIVSFLCLCETLEHLILDGNIVCGVEQYRDLVKEYIPFLKSLDEISFSEDANILEINHELSDLEKEENIKNCENSLTLFMEKKCKIILPKLENSSTNSTNSSRPNTSDCTPTVLSKLIPIKRPATTNDAIFLDNFPYEGSTKCSPGSNLTSGSPICGNITAALRNRLSPKNT